MSLQHHLGVLGSRRKLSNVPFILLFICLFIYIKSCLECRAIEDLLVGINMWLLVKVGGFISLCLRWLLSIMETNKMFD